ncbi:MAG: MBL fold metallo-hydrolase [Candidatus Fermentibacteria bacterium]|nr:MBL fold metallo-hydrolase [Candidatus Fermentibacteria bacterium]
MNLAVLASGSSGNALAVEYRGQMLFFDAGLSGKQHLLRLESSGLPGADPIGLFLSHEHGDHSRAAGILARKWEIPVFGTEGTIQGSKLIGKKLHGIEYFSNGDTVQIGQFTVQPWTISHDARDPSGFTVTAGGRKLGIATDMGVFSPLVQTMLQGCHGLVFEFNHDIDMLWNGSYPWPLKQRIASGEGHLSNDDAAEALASIVHGELGFCVAAHLSEENNTAELALKTAEQVSEGKFRVLAGKPYQALPFFEV